MIGSIDFIHSCYPYDVIATVCHNLWQHHHHHCRHYDHHCCMRCLLLHNCGQLNLIFQLHTAPFTILLTEILAHTTDTHTHTPSASHIVLFMRELPVYCVITCIVVVAYCHHDMLIQLQILLSIFYINVSHSFTFFSPLLSFIHYCKLGKFEQSIRTDQNFAIEKREFSFRSHSNLYMKIDYLRERKWRKCDLHIPERLH